MRGKNTDVRASDPACRIRVLSKRSNGSWFRSNMKDYNRFVITFMQLWGARFTAHLDKTGRVTRIYKCAHLFFVLFLLSPSSFLPSSCTHRWTGERLARVCEWSDGPFIQQVEPQCWCGVTVFQPCSVSSSLSAFYFFITLCAHWHQSAMT